MTYYKGFVGGVVLPYGVEDTWYPVDNNLGTHFDLTTVPGWYDPQAPIPLLHELIQNHTLSQQSFTQTYQVDSFLKTTNLVGSDIDHANTFGNNASYFALPAFPSGKYLDNSSGFGVQITSDYTHTTPTHTSTHSGTYTGSYSDDAVGRTTKTYNLTNAPSNTQQSASIPKNWTVRTDWNLAYKDTRRATIYANGSTAGWYFTDTESSYNYQHSSNKYGQYLGKGIIVPPKCTQINVTVYNPYNNQVMARTVTYPSRRSPDNGYIWNTSEQTRFGGNPVIYVRQTNGQVLAQGTRIDFEFVIHTFQDRNLNQDITSNYIVSYLAGTPSLYPRVSFSLRSSAPYGATGDGPYDGCEIQGDVVWPVRRFNHGYPGFSGHQGRTWNNILGQPSSNFNARYAADKPVKSIVVTIRNPDGSISPLGRTITRPAADPNHGYLNGVPYPISGTDEVLVDYSSSGSVVENSYVEIAVTYDLLVKNNANIDWSSYYTAVIDSGDTSNPKLWVTSNGSVFPAGQGVPYGVDIQPVYRLSDKEITAGHGKSTIVSQNLHDADAYSEYIGGVDGLGTINGNTYGCYNTSVIVRNAAGQNVTSQTTYVPPVTEQYGFYSTNLPFTITKTNGDPIPHDWTVEVTESHNLFQDTGANINITNQYTFNKAPRYDANGNQIGYYLVVQDVGGLGLGPWKGSRMRARYEWPQYYGGMPLIILLGQ